MGMGKGRTSFYVMGFKPGEEKRKPAQGPDSHPKELKQPLKKLSTIRKPPHFRQQSKEMEAAAGKKTPQSAVAAFLACLVNFKISNFSLALIVAATRLEPSCSQQCREKFCMQM